MTRSIAQVSATAELLVSFVPISHIYTAQTTWSPVSSVLSDSVVSSRLSCLPVIKTDPRTAVALRDSSVLFVYADYPNYSFVCRQRELVGQWTEWPSSATVLAAVSGRSAAGPPWESQKLILPRNLCKQREQLTRIALVFMRA